MKVIVKGLPGEGKTVAMDIIIAALKEYNYIVTAVEHGYLEGEEAYSVETIRKTRTVHDRRRDANVGTSR